MPFSPFPSFPCFFWFPCFFLARNSLQDWAPFLSFPGILGALQRKISLPFWWVFLALFRKSKEKQIRANTLRHKTNTCRKKILGELIFCANTCGACIRTRANTGKYFGGIIFCILAKFLRDFISVRIHVAPVFALAQIQENTPGKLFMYWFRARGY